MTRGAKFGRIKMNGLRSAVNHNDLTEGDISDRQKDEVAMWLCEP